MDYEAFKEKYKNKLIDSNIMYDYSHLPKWLINDIKELEKINEDGSVYMRIKEYINKKEVIMTEELFKEAEDFNKLDGLGASKYLTELIKEGLSFETIIDKLKEYYAEK